MLLRIAFAAEGGGGTGVDLCVLFELAGGRKGIVQPLGGAAGAPRLPPYVRLDGDLLSVDLGRAARFRRVLVHLALRGADRSGPSTAHTAGAWSGLRPGPDPTVRGRGQVGSGRE